jgi:hypothetical protein
MTARSLSHVARRISSQIQDLECKQGHKVDGDSVSRSVDVDSEIGEIEDATAEAQKSLSEFLAFVKTFDLREFSTIYCEREWRSTRQFPFTLNDVAMIVLPKRGNVPFFDHFVNEEAPKLKIGRAIPVVPWEDLVEH